MVRIFTDAEQNQYMRLTQKFIALTKQLAEQGERINAARPDTVEAETAKYKEVNAQIKATLAERQNTSI